MTILYLDDIVNIKIINNYKCKMKDALYVSNLNDMSLTGLIKNENKHLFEVNSILQLKDEVVAITDLINSAY